jgi:uncharacterized membrane protein
VPDISPFHREFVFIHVLGVFVFLLAHGVSAGVMFRIQRESDPQSVRALLKLSEASISMMIVGALVILASGIIAGFSGDYWTTGSYWVWASLALFLVVGILMTPLARSPLNRIRDAVDSGDTAAIQAATASTRPMLVAGLGVGAIVVLTWLMMYKPF